MIDRFRQALQSDKFVVTYETVPGRGAREEIQCREIEAAKHIHGTGLVDAITFADNPGGNPAILADSAAEEFASQGISTLVHFTCKDRNRNQILSQLYALERRGLNNLLVMSGDFMGSGWWGKASPVFDLDPVQTLKMIGEMNEGLVTATFRGTAREKPTRFFPGVAVSPFKWIEAETMTQYYKLEKKIAAGAKFAISQIGFDAHKMAELPRYLDERGYGLPLFANIYVLSAAAARYMRTGKVPGCFISRELLDVLTEEAQADDKGRQARLQRSAKVIAVARGLGYRGAHIGGLNVTADDIRTILALADEVRHDWRACAKELCFGKPDGFYLYDESGGKSIEPVPAHANHAYPESDIELSADDIRQNPKYAFLRKTGIVTCPKNECNGPCGGGVDTWCEMYPEKRRCVYVIAYTQLKNSGELEALLGPIYPPTDRNA